MASCKIRAPIDAPKYKDYILALLFLKRLSDVFTGAVANLYHGKRLVSTIKEFLEKNP
ncbi:MAG: type I restriction-modification system subunit M N-terminal domain-containing protein [Candidatus Aminicenantales bacterium]